jgi:hypothetical protein
MKSVLAMSMLAICVGCSSESPRHEKSSPQKEQKPVAVPVVKSEPKPPEPPPQKSKLEMKKERVMRVLLKVAPDPNISVVYWPNQHMEKFLEGKGRQTILLQVRMNGTLSYINVDSYGDKIWMVNFPGRFLGDEQEVYVQEDEVDTGIKN